MQGLIIENISNLYKIKAKKGIYEANARGKFKKEEITPVVGDKVEIQILDKENKKDVIAIGKIGDLFSGRGITKEIHTKGNEDGIDKTIIPITKNGEIIDGAHRLAIALYFNLKVPFVMFDLLDANYNKQFFINRGFNEKYAKIIDKEIVEKNNYNIDLEGIKKWRKKIIQKYLWYCVP